MIALLARCVPQDFVNSFIPAATQATFGAGLLVLWTGFLWIFSFSHALRARHGFAWLLRGLAIAATVAAIPAVSIAVWIWAQANGFILWCTPPAGDTGARLDAQAQHLDMATNAGITVLVVALILVAVSALAIGLSALIMRTRGVRLAQPPVA